MTTQEIRTKVKDHQKWATEYRQCARQAQRDNCPNIAAHYISLALNEESSRSYWSTMLIDRGES